jgi:hypothetical protein
MSDQQGYNQNWQSQYQQPQHQSQPQQAAGGYVFNQMTGQWEIAGGGYGYPPKRAIWPGLVSCILGAIALLCGCVMVVGIGSFLADNPEYVQHPELFEQLDPNNMPGAVIAAGCSMIVGGFIALVGLIFGVVGLCMPNASKGWAIGGLIANGVLLLGTCCLIVIG